jgi:hypothetical protein
MRTKPKPRRATSFIARRRLEADKRPFRRSTAVGMARSGQFAGNCRQGPVTRRAERRGRLGRLRRPRQGLVSKSESNPKCGGKAGKDQGEARPGRGLSILESSRIRKAGGQGFFFREEGSPRYSRYPKGAESASGRLAVTWAEAPPNGPVRAAECSRIVPPIRGRHRAGKGGPARRRALDFPSFRCKKRRDMRGPSESEP